MKKRLLTIVTCTMLGALCAFGLTACGHEHSYTSVVTPPTCTTEGFTTHTCECGDSYTDTTVPVVDHSFTNYVSDGNATYDADGTKTATCDNCSATDTIADAGSRLKGTVRIVYGNGTADKVITEYKGTAVGTIADPTKTGYTFAGWDKEIPATVGEGETVITAKWTVNQYKIVLVYGNGVADKEIVKDYGTVITEVLPDELIKTGYTFAGWDKDMPATMGAEDVTITAKWDINQYKVTLVYGNGTQDKVITQDYNTDITEVLPDGLTKTGYTFAGWDKDMPAKMTQDVTITAKWTVNQYTITIKLNNGEDDIVITQDYDTVIDAIEEPTKEHYKFTGWDKDIPAKMPVVEDTLEINALYTLDIKDEDVEFETVGYVTDEDDILVLDEIGEYEAESMEAIMIGGVVLTAEQYSVTDNAIVFNQSVVTEYLGSYQTAYVLADGIAGAVEILFANKALDDALEVEEAFDYGDQQLGDVFERNDNTYVLTDDVDMTGVVMNNRMLAAGKTTVTYTDNGDGTYTYDKTTSTASDVGFGGIFDGRGHVISNVTVEMTNWSLGQHIVDEAGKKSYINAQAMGFFSNILEGAVIKNVAFTNVAGTGKVNNNFGLTGIMGNRNAGTIENVYFGFKADNVIARGPIAGYDNTAVLKNVVVDYPMTNYSISGHLESAYNASKDNYYATYAYGYGAFGSGNSPMNKNVNYENVFIVSPMPVNLYKGTGGYSTIQNMVYAENETELKVLTYNYTVKVDGVNTPKTLTYQLGTTVADAIAAETETGDAHTFQVAGIRRYDNAAAMGADTDYVQKLVETGLFKVVDGQVMWHSLKPVVEITEATDFDAAEGKLLSTVLADKEILSAKVNGEELAVENGKIVGVPELNNLTSETQNFVISIETEETVYNFTNAIYWASVINDQAELVAALDYDYSADNKNNFGFYKLGNGVNIDANDCAIKVYNANGALTSGKLIDYSDMKDAGTWNGVSAVVGFAGIFDGAGYTIDFNKTIGSDFGLFGAFGTGAQVGIKQPVTVKNLAIIDIGGVNWKPILAQFGAIHTYNKGVLLENLYITWEKDSIMAGLIYEPVGKGNVINNVVVDIENNRQYGAVAAGYANKAVYGEAISDKTLLANGYYGGTLFYNLRRGDKGIETTVTNFISLGKGGLGYTNNNFKTFYKSTANGDGTYAHVLKNGGWSGTACNPEAYYLYAGNQEYGDQARMTGMKAGFAEIAKNYANGTKIEGYYCAACGQVFALEEGNCTTCVVEETPVALTKSADLWNEAISYTWKTTKISEVNNANVGTTGEVVVAGASKYDSTSEMKAAYEVNNEIFASFTGETGNGLWKVVEGKLTWVGAAA